MKSELITDQPREYQEDRSNELLAPLVYGLPVSMAVNDPKILRKKRITTTIIFIVPISHFGLPEGKLMVSVTGGGCEVVDIDNLKSISFYRAGLSMHSSRLLVAELNRLFDEQ